MSPPLPYREITVSVSPAALEAAVEYLVAHAGGVAVEEGAEAHLRAYLPLADGVELRLAVLRAGLETLAADVPGLVGFRWSERTVDEADWAQAWRAHFHPLRVGRRLLVAPTWESPRRFPGEVLLRLDPGMAFGTGTHASTVLCLEAVELLAPRGGHALDVGTGSGILAVAAALLGARRVTALDIDPVAVCVAKDNARANRVDAVLDIRYGSLADVRSPALAPADWAVANLTADVLVGLAPELGRAVAPGGVLVASGVVATAQAEVQAALAAAGMPVCRSTWRDGWAALWAVRRPTGVEAD